MCLYIYFIVRITIFFAAVDIIEIHDKNN